jgi:hypothetical protein
MQSFEESTIENARYRLSCHDLLARRPIGGIGESRSFDKLRMTGLGACPVLDTGVKSDNDKIKVYG